jgi:hypothetical protein
MDFDLNDLEKDFDLNNLEIAKADGPWEPLWDPSTMSRQATVKVYFRGLEEELIGRLQEAHLVVGCIAWLTNERILQAMTWPDYGVAIVAHKEEFLCHRHDPSATAAEIRRTPRLRELYSNLKMRLGHEDFGGLMATLSGRREGLDPVRCAGEYRPSYLNRATARMHHKFLVFCNVVETTDPHAGDRFRVIPREVWTGSFNLTWNAGRSLENAVLIQDPRIARAYYDEWMQVEAISEPLDWLVQWPAPEWHITP